MVKPSLVCWLVAAAVSVSTPLPASLVELASSGQWERLLLVANRRAEQLPLQPEEALLAAAAARAVGDRAAELRHLRRAAEAGPLAGVARLELAEALAGSDPAAALELAVPFLGGAETRAMREAAAAVAAEALEGGVDAAARAAVERSLRALPVGLKRQLELALARTDAAGGRPRLIRLLRASAGDLPALDAARGLQELGSLSVEERWLVAQCLFQHALYREAEPLLDELDGAAGRAVPQAEVAFLAGRCAFREGRFDEAAARYQVALARSSGAERRAELELHLARAHELAGRLDEAVGAAIRSVAARPNDDRRLFLARLRLRLDQPERARAGVELLGGRSARTRGALLLATYELRRERWEAARRRLEAIRSGPASGPAAVLAAGLAIDAGDGAAAIRLLDQAAASLDPFWAERARAQLARLPEPAIDDWRDRITGALETADPTSRRRLLARWAVLEPDPEPLARIRHEVGAAAGLAGDAPAPSFPAGLAERLWSAGLQRAAARWDPGGFPARSAAEALWTAQQLIAHGAPERGLMAADRAWRMAGAELPVRAYPESLQRALFPLPFPEQTWRGAVASELPWTLVAGVAREESRWQPAAMSEVGARGVMQLMPATAGRVAALHGLPPPSLDALFDPELSLTLGSLELGRLFRAFDGQPAPVAAAYNAGEAQARLWLAECGAPCPSERYVAAISFSVTARYTRDVLAAAATYADLYGARPVGGATPTAAAGGLSGAGSASHRSARPLTRASARSRR